MTPHDLQVLEGSEALLRCEVSNLAGQVQWTKDGFALGEYKTNLIRTFQQLRHWVCIDICMQMVTDAVEI